MNLTLLLRYGMAMLLVAGCLAGCALGETPEERTARYLESVRNQPPLLLAFLREVPKGGDLHNHLEGAVYAEDAIDWAAESGMCIERTASRVIAPPCDPCETYTQKPAARCAYGDHVLYNQLVDAWSMRNWKPGDESGHDHFFAAFDKFGGASRLHAAELMATATNRAGMDHLQYVEFMHTADGMDAAMLGKQLGWNDEFGKMREALLAGGLKDIVSGTSRKLAADQAKAKAILKCGTPQAEPGCAVTVRFLYQVLRGLPREWVFAQIVLGFELASSDPNFVGLNLVMPEDWYVPMHDFDLHMAMLDYLHGVYPKVHITLHADELAMGLVPPEGLRFHIRRSIEKGHAERIGHGTAVMNEKDPVQLLKEMAEKNVLVEISLTSSDLILGVSGDAHPLPVYLKFGVPVALATDDEGVSRSDMTHEWLRAEQEYKFSYDVLKRMARQSLEHSFLPGESLWRETRNGFRMVGACEHDVAASACQKFLEGSERARAQWGLEAEFGKFEKEF